MFDLYNEKKIEFENIITNYFDTKNNFNEILNYSIDVGKRIRPLILLETYNMISDNINKNVAIDFAIALEFIHNYSLIHDDLPSMDDDNYRRGRKTTHYKYGEDYAILAGDALLNYAYELLFSILENNPSKNFIMAAKYLSNASGINGMIYGQVIDINDEINDAKKLVEMYKNKTCKLIMAATTIPGYIANKGIETIKLLENLGFYIGMAFQIQDDILDIEKDNSINKVTYISHYGKDKAYSDMIDYSKKALDIIDKYENNYFLKKLIEELINRKH